MKKEKIPYIKKLLFVIFLIVLGLYFFPQWIPLVSQPLEHNYWRTVGREKGKLPIVYSPEYNITFWGIEKLHPFDSEKYKQVVELLSNEKTLNQKQLYVPQPVDWNWLARYHDPEYLKSLEKAFTLTKITEIPILLLLPWALTHHQVLAPMMMMTGGTLVASKLALEYGWSINLGGGFHHAHQKGGGGFCAFADITMAVKEFRKNTSQQSKVMIIDLDAHQGNGHNRDFVNDEGTFILDIYNSQIYPHDEEAKKGIDHAVELRAFTENEAYIQALSSSLKESFAQFTPDLIIYNAGTDILESDPLGRMNINEETVILRDELVFREAISRKIPIVMLLSGGYQKSNARVIANSIKNLLPLLPK